ncbi:UNVERIFIED_CONTAM: hypothetical protein FKN15_010898 [Acipenser sinensis]
MQSDGEFAHKEAGIQRMSRDEKDVQQMYSTVNTLMRNPFEVQEDFIPLSNIATGMALKKEDAVRLLSAKQLGEEAHNRFVENRLQNKSLSVFDPIKKIKLPTFANINHPMKSNRGKKKTNIIKTDRELFSRLLIAA